MIKEDNVRVGFFVNLTSSLYIDLYLPTHFSMKLCDLIHITEK